MDKYREAALILNRFEPSIHTSRLERAFLDQADLFNNLSEEQREQVEVMFLRYVIWMEELLRDSEPAADGSLSEGATNQLLEQLYGFVKIQRLVNNNE